MKRLIITILSSLLILNISTSGLFADQKADEIAAKASHHAFYSGNDGKAQVSMVITDKNGSTRTREFVILRKDRVEDKEQFYYVYFKKPSDVRKMVFMVWKNITKDDDRWLYLPALDLVKRIAASDKRTSFVGSDFLYEDVSGRGVNEDVHEIINQTADSYTLKNTPKNKSNVEFAYYNVVIDKKTNLPKKAEYYNKANQKYRVVEALEIQNIQGFPTITKMAAQNLDTGSKTILSFNKVAYNIGLKDNIFSERYLRRVPREVRR